ncbi:hypothetical protein C5S53_11505 [Methanophagales archaeon]|jgi:ribonuclease HI|nr:hypothetical protein C5S53_11505 [Methanophagales archaeon]
MGIGVVLIENKKSIAKISQKLADLGTNNIAEYTALLTELTKALRHKADGYPRAGTNINY